MNPVNNYEYLFGDISIINYRIHLLVVIEELLAKELGRHLVAMQHHNL